MNRLYASFVHPAFLNPSHTVIAQGPSARGQTESNENSNVSSAPVHTHFSPMNFSQGFQAIYSRPFFGFTPSQLTPHKATPIVSALLSQPGLNTEMVSSQSSDKAANDSRSGETQTTTATSQQLVVAQTTTIPQVVYTRAAIPLNSIQMGINYFMQSIPNYGRLFSQVINPQGAFYSTTQNLFQNAIIPIQQASQAASSNPRPNSFYLPPSSYYATSKPYPQYYSPYGSYYSGQSYPQSYPSAPIMLQQGGAIVVKPNPTTTTVTLPYSSSSAAASTKPFGQSQIQHGATLDDFVPKEPPKNPREKGAFFAAVCEKYKKYANQTDLKNCAEDAMTLGGRFIHAILGIQQKNARVLSEYLDSAATMPFYANYDAMIDSAIQYANEHGFAVISFSGHGVNVPANFAAIKDQINPPNLVNIPLAKYESKGMVSCQLTLDGKYYSDRRLLSKLMGLNENAFVLIIFDNCHNDFDFPRSITGKEEIINNPPLNGLIKGCVTFLASCKFEETSSDGVPTKEFPAGAGAATAAYTYALESAAKSKGIDNISFRELVTTAQKRIQGTQTLVLSSTHLFEPDDLVPLTPEGAKAFMEKHRAVTV